MKQLHELIFPRPTDQTVALARSLVGLSSIVAAAAATWLLLVAVAVMLAWTTPDALGDHLLNTVADKWLLLAVSTVGAFVMRWVAQWALRGLVARWEEEER